ADLLDWPNGVKSDVVEGAERAARRGRNTAVRRVGERARRIFQRVIRRYVVDVQSCEPRRLNVEPLVAPRAGAGSTAARRGEVDSVTSADHKGMGQLIGEAETRLNRFVESIVVVAIVRIGEDLDSMQRVELAGHRKRRNRVGIKPVHAVI